MYTTRKVRVQGNLDLLRDCPYRAATIIGSRKAHPRAERLAANVAQFLARKGWVIVSGLAPGVDLAAHRATVKAGGKTIAVLGEGLCAISRNADMASEILQAHGLLVSTVPDHQAATRASLMDRNWLTVGLARVVIVVQADQPSGSLDAALKALQLESSFPLARTRSQSLIWVRAGDLGSWSEPGCVACPATQPKHSPIRLGALFS